MADDQPNTLKSHQIAKVVDLLSEGPIRGVVGGLKGVYLDGVVWENPDGTMNVRNDVTATFVSGYSSQPIMKGFAAQQSEQTVGVQLKYDVPIIRAITNTDTDRCRITVSVPALQHVDTDSGDVNGSSVRFVIDGQAGTGGWKRLVDNTITGKSTSRYQRSLLFNLPGVGPWNIRVIRATADNTKSDIQNDLYWDSYTELIDDKVNYTWSACVGMVIDAEQYQTIPSRVYLVDGLIINIPSNYDPDAATYSGTWDGTFVKDWTNNPAWVFLDLVIHERYGLGRWMSSTMVDKWALYKIAQFCDARVPNGKGGTERRFTCNVQITSQQEAFDLLAQIAGIFRGFAYWTGGMLVANADDPADPIAQYTNANVIDGQFTYSGADIRARHTQVTVAWNDPKNLGEPRRAIVEDQEAISRYGIQSLELQAIGCTSEAQAIRTGKWSLYTEEYESETVQFSTGLETAWVRPGDIVRVMDVNVAGKRRGGRVAAGTTASLVFFDGNAGSLDAGGTTYLSCIIGEGGIETRQVVTWNGTSCTVSSPFSAVPAPDTVFVVNDDNDLEPTLWRVLGSRQTSSDRYEIAAMRHFPEKWAVVERDAALTEPDISDIITRWPAVTDLKVVEYLVQTSPISVGVRATVSWKSGAPSFDVYWRKGNTNVGHARTDQAAIDIPVTEGIWTFQVIPVSGLGIKGTPADITKEIIGRFAPPAAPKVFRIMILDSMAHFKWAPAPELDVIIGGHFELRHSSRTQGATWASSQVVIRSIPGNATSVEAVYRVGTWFLRTYDIVGTASSGVATIIALAPDGRYNEFARICESPDYLGSRVFTEVMTPQNWLIIGETGGAWDEQLANMDTWPTVDVLAEFSPDPPYSVPRHGWYEFEDRIDAGGIFTVRFTADVLAFPYQEGDIFIDGRLDNCDRWADWDDMEEGLGGEVQLFIRTTNEDPSLSGADWGEWQPFAPVEYTARGFEFRADLFAPAGQNIGVETLCITADLRMKMDSGEDIPYPAAIKHITFKSKFYLLPSVVITVQNAVATDTIQVLNKTRTGFDLNITNAGAQVTRVFDWQARGY